MSWPLNADGVWAEIRRPAAVGPARPGLFLDRDGVVNVDIGFLSDPADVALTDGAAALVRMANDAGAPVCIVTNQSGIDRGLYGWAEFAAVQDRIHALLAEAGAHIDAVAACPFHPEYTPDYGDMQARWRKPGPAMIEILANALKLDTATSWLVGDRLSDIKAAHAAGLAGAFHLLTVNGAEDRAAALAEAGPSFAVRTMDDLANAVTILQETKGFVFGSKAETLARLATHMSGDRAAFCAQYILCFTDWRDDRAKALEAISRQFPATRLAVRSSAASEDRWAESMAGRFTSVTDVPSETVALRDAIATVFASYDNAGNRDQVLIQPMVPDVSVSGVVVTRDLDTGGPYYVVSYDDFSGRTDTVTGGAVSKTILVHRSRPEALHSTRFRKLIELVRRIEAVTRCDELDIEFCIDGSEQVFILQVRPLATRSQWQAFDDGAVSEALSALRESIIARTPAPQGVAGAYTILGEMPDWNPAEMIGNAPRPLAMSLYRTLITDDVWWRARANMGYRAVPQQLMTELAGRPYIDVRLSLNSFLPASLDEKDVDALVAYQLAALAENRELHDKIEFEIAATCLDFDYDTYAGKLAGAEIGQDTSEALKAGLREITNRAITGGRAGIEVLLAHTASLPDGHSSKAPLELVRCALDACRQYGTLPFAELARHGFIGVALLRSLVRRGVLDQAAHDDFFAGIETVAGALVRDMSAISRDETRRDSFLATYGHLRPGTYDILSWRYDEKPDLYLGHSLPEPAMTKPFRMTAQQRRGTESLIDEAGLQTSVDALLDYVTATVAAREQCKFVFTRTLSNSLADICRWGETVGLDRDALSFLTIQDILDDTATPEALRDSIGAARARYALTRIIRLPDLIAEPDDIDVVRLPLGKPNFITGKSVTGFTTFLHAHDTAAIDNRIILIESADPGFDWIFSHPIQGLVTKYGGTNSHMAIRCAEFGLPAAIGCGERLFNQLAQAQSIALDCGARVVRAIGGPEHMTGK